MDDRLLKGLGDGCTGEERRETLEYFEYLKSIPDGWKLCASDFTQQLHSEAHVKFFCLQVLEHQAKHRHASSSDDDILTFRKYLLAWIQPTVQEGVGMEAFIKNKMAQIYALVFVTDYPSKWPHFFTSLLQYVQSGHCWTIDLYLRILLAIDSEVVDRQVVHSPDENIRNTAIKDIMREQCIPDLVESWLQIIVKFEQSNHSLVCQALEVVGAYIAWIDISLIANDRFISLLLKYLSDPNLRESSADCLHEIISKGMEPVAKTKLIESLYKALKSLGVLSPKNIKGDEEVDFEVRLSKLMNGMGCGLIASWNKLVKADDGYKNVTLAAIESKLPYLQRYLSDGDDGVSEAIISFATQYIGMLKSSNLSDTDRTNLHALLDAVICKLQYDESYDFENEGEEEIMFLEFRKQLKVLFDAIAQVDPSLVLQTSQTWLSTVLLNLSSEPFMRVEMVLRLFYMLGEVITDKQYGAVNVLKSPWHQMMSNVVQSQVALYPHTAVIQQYYEVVVRYEKFFTLETAFIAPVMETFLSVNGLRHPSSSLRSRLSYLLVRFIKGVRSAIGVYANQILENLQQLLAMLPGSESYKMYLSNNDMNFLYEAAGILVVSSPHQPQDKQKLMRSIVSPIAEQFPIFLARLATSTDPKQQEYISKALYALISFASRASKAFTNHQQVLSNGCLDCFSEILPVFLHGLEVNIQRDVLHSGVRQYLHRMVICLGDELLNYVPLAVSLLLKNCKGRDIQEFIPLINQLIVKYKQRLLPVLEEIFLPVCAGIIACNNLPFDSNDHDEQRDRTSLQKSYFLFISSVVNNNLHEVITKQGSEQVQELLNLLIQSAVEFPDPGVQRICFSILRRLIEIWALEGGLAGFIELMYSHILPACFIAPLKHSFDLDDGQFYLVLGEIAGVLKSMFTGRGEEFILALQRYLSSVHIPANIIEELVLKLQGSDIKVIRSSLKIYFTRLRA